MPLSALFLILAAAVDPASEAPAKDKIVVRGYAWAPFISPMGEPFRARAPGDDTLARWFRQADANGDGILTPAEMQADADRFFRTLDTNHDGIIDSEELVAYEWEVAPEIQVNSRWRSPRGQPAAEPQPDAAPDTEPHRRRDDGADGYHPSGFQGAARYSLLNIPEPVAGADADFNRAITLAEFRQAALQRFQLLDRQRLGKLNLADLEGLVPARPKPGHGPKPQDDAPDARIGLPLPQDH